MQSFAGNEPSSSNEFTVQLNGLLKAEEDAVNSNGENKHREIYSRTALATLVWNKITPFSQLNHWN